VGKRGSRKKQRSGGGAGAQNARQGYRSEQLADYVFTAWGTVTPVRGGNDHGLDLYCSLTDRVEQRALVREFFAAQVKSEGFSWNLGTPDAVKWFIDHPTPLFLCVVEKNQGRVSIY
jgi:hypothetical protein